MFEDKVAIITGGGGGIGLAAAQMLAAQGARVLITGRTQSTLEEAAATHPNIKALVADASDPESATKTVAAALGYWGRIDIVVNNAGGGVIQPLEHANAESVNKVFDINVTGPILLASAALPSLEETKGTIINISSTYGSKAGAGLSLYGASKAALEHLTRCWALELAPKGIRVNSVASGPVESAFLKERMGLGDEQIAAVKEQERNAIPLGRRGVPDDVAAWIVNLAAPGWITGQSIPVDGGLAVA